MRSTTEALFKAYGYRVKHGSAKTRGLTFELSFEQFSALVNSNCFYCGRAPRNGVDRVDNAKGYLPNNCVPSCHSCNVRKARKVDYPQILNSPVIKQIESEEKDK